MGRAPGLLLDQRADQVVDRKGAKVGSHRAGVELGKVEQRAQKLLERRKTPVRLVDEAARLRRHAEPVERRERQAGGVQRLQQVVADRGEDRGFEQVGGLGLLLGAAQVRVDRLDRAQGLLQLLGSAADLVVERDRRLEQRIGVRLPIVGALDPRDEFCVDLFELGDLAPQLVDFARALRHDFAARLRPIATPVKVWFTCMEVNCSP